MNKKFHSFKRISLEHLSDIAWKTEISYLYIYFIGSEQFVGRMQDFRLYQVALTNR